MISRSTPVIAWALPPFTATRLHDTHAQLAAARVYARSTSRDDLEINHAANAGLNVIDRLLEVFYIPGLRFPQALIHRKHRVDPYRYMLDNKEALP